MGTTYAWQTRADLLAEILAGAHASEDRGGEVYAIHSGAEEHGGGKRFLVVHLIKSDGATRARWGVKSMGEDEGPYYWDCPLDLLDQADAAPTEGAARWREAVRYYQRQTVRGPVGLELARNHAHFMTMDPARRG